MKRTAIAIAAALAVGAPTAFAARDFDDYAVVKEVDPEYERVNVPRKECYTEYEPRVYRREDQRSLVGPLIGGVAGGLLGAQVGKGSGRVAASAAGAAVGAIVGDRLGNRDRGSTEEYYEREVRRCRMVDNWERRIAGYHVVYEYAGRTYTAVLPYDPGPRLPIRVHVEPARDGHAFDD
jgi:uncharacterized protein YcfJ